MRRTRILTACVCAAALAVCALSLWFVGDTVAQARRLGSLAVLEAENGRPDAARERMVRLADFWQQRSATLELLASHDALHDVAQAVAQASVCLECADHDDFLREMSTASLALDHLLDEQTVRWGNLC